MTGVLAGVLERAARRLPHPVERLGGQTRMGDGLRRGADRVTALLKAHDVAPDEPVHLRMGNRVEDIEGLLGIWQAGAVAVPIHVSAAASTAARL
jgi:long-chain acyl-CoA synthetase